MKFSVVIPMYNTAPYVEATVRSVLAQEFSDFEVIVVNDGSTDGCERVVAAIGDPRIRIINKPNTGVSDTRNVGCRESRGEYIAFLDSDDYWYPDHLSEAARFFALHPEIKWYGARQFCLPFGTVPPREGRGEAAFNVRNYFVSGKGYIHSTSMIVSREVVEKSGGYPAGMRYFEDYLFQGKLASVDPFLGANERVTSIYFNRRPGSATVVLPPPEVLCPDYRRALHVLSDGAHVNHVKVPLWPLSVLRLFLRTMLFHVPKDVMLGYVTEFGALSGRMRLRRWQFFVKVAYWLMSCEMTDEFRKMVGMTAKARYKSTIRIARHYGFGGAIRWFLAVFHYTLRGVMDTLQDRLEVKLHGGI